MSCDHPNMQEMSSPKTSKCLQTLRRKRKRAACKKGTDSRESTNANTKIKRLTNYDVYEFISRNSIKNETELYAVASRQKAEGKKDLANILLSRSQKAISDLFASTKQLDTALTVMERLQKNRMELLKEATKAPCECHGQWFSCATEVLIKNGTHPFVFADRVRQLLNFGRSKQRNIMIVGPTNCGKSFLLRPLEKIYKAFVNPANDKYGWVVQTSAK